MLRLTTFMGAYIADIYTRSSSSRKFIKEIENKTGKHISELRIICETDVFHGLSSRVGKQSSNWLLKEEEKDQQKERYGFWNVHSALGAQTPVRAALQFVVTRKCKDLESLSMGSASTTTTMEHIVQWLSTQPVCKSADAVQFYLEDFGKTPYFPLHEEPCSASEWSAQIVTYICHKNPIRVSLKSYGWNSATESPQRQSFMLRHLKAMKPVLQLWPLIKPDTMYMDRKRQLTTNGPNWRSVNKGLVVEGFCTNNKCETKESPKWNTVFLSYGFKNFDLLRGNKYLCPSCLKHVEPKRYGFYDCLWKVVRVSSGNNEPFTDGWRNSRKKYEKFEWCSDKRIEFSRFQVFVRPISDRISCKSSDPVPKDCAICFGGIEKGSGYQLLCRHIFHKKCIENSADDHLEKECDPTCVLCHQKYSPPLENAELDQALKDVNVLISTLHLSETHESQLKSAVDKIQRLCHKNDRKYHIKLGYNRPPTR